jgi:polar amino acid transport system substrate-binding protein
VQRWRLFLAVVFLCPGLASGSKMRVCTDVRAHPPYLLPDGSGSVGRLVSQAAREAGLELEFYPASLERCRAEGALNLVHAFTMTPYLPKELPFVAYPRRDGTLDKSRATLRARIMLFRRIGTGAKWNGKRITGLKGPVLVSAGSVAMIAAIKGADAPVDEQGKSLEVNLAKMMAGRGDLAVGFEEEGLALLALPEFAGKVEMMPRPLSEHAYFMVVSKPYYRQHRAAVEKMWNAIGRLNQSAKALKK